MAVPLLLAALGELIAERAGVLNIGLEGMLLSGAFAALVVALPTGSTALGVAARWRSAPRSACSRTLRRALEREPGGRGHGAQPPRRRPHRRRLSRRVRRHRRGADDRRAPVLPIPCVARTAGHRPALFNQTLLGYAAFAASRSSAGRWRARSPGCSLRMVGENPSAAETQGVAVRRTRIAALICCGVLAAAGGAYLSLAYANTFVEGMSAGRGFIALAIVIVGRRHPVGVMLAALFFGFATALQFHFQAMGLHVPFQFFLILPYVMTLLVLAGRVGRATAPAALGQPYERG